MGGGGPRSLLHGWPASTEQGVSPDHCLLAGTAEVGWGKILQAPEERAPGPAPSSPGDWKKSKSATHWLLRQAFLEERGHGEKKRGGGGGRLDWEGGHLWGLRQGTALTWEVAWPPRRACSRAISAASSSVRLREVRGSLKCSNSSLTRAWREAQDADTPPLAQAGSPSSFRCVMGMRFGKQGRSRTHYHCF